MNSTNKTLSPRAQDLLQETCEHASLADGETCGFYAEFESNGYKPWLPKDVAELVEAELVTLDDSSDDVPSLNDLRVDEEDESDEEYDGVAFLKPTQSGLDAAKELGLL